MKQAIISPSVMCADLLNLQRDIDTLSLGGVRFLHIDFMDGRFVPNITFGTDIVRSFLRCTAMRRDIHIMAHEPSQYFDAMKIGRGDIVSVHLEACSAPHAVFGEIKRRGADAFAALCPDTPIAAVREYMSELDGILVMTVQPGFAGQPMAQGSYERIAEARELIDQSGREMLLQVDGSVSFEHCVIMRQNGADMFVAGSSSIFNGDGIGVNLQKMTELLK